MAARPVASLVAVTLPPDFGEHRATALFDAMRETAAHYGCPLIGGDIAFHGDNTHPLTCSVVVLAEPIAGRPIARAAARIDDIVYVTGVLGGSLDDDGRGRHLTFEPRIAEAIEIARRLGDRLHAMIDLSDGLGRDAGHIADLSKLTIEIDAACLPAAHGLPWQRAAGDGEDYELLFTARGDVPSRVCGDVPITAIGRVCPRGGELDPAVVFIDGDTRIPGDELGWEHRS
jgi:thiamine-monophosphate kinase